MKEGNMFIIDKGIETLTERELPDLCVRKQRLDTLPLGNG
jgi:hypothetical protein